MFASNQHLPVVVCVASCGCRYYDMLGATECCCLGTAGRLNRITPSLADASFIRDVTIFYAKQVHSAPLDLLVPQTLLTHLMDADGSLSEAGYLVATLEAAVSFIAQVRWGILFFEHASTNENPRKPSQYSLPVGWKRPVHAQVQ